MQEHKNIGLATNQTLKGVKLGRQMCWDVGLRARCSSSCLILSGSFASYLIHSELHLTFCSCHVYSCFEGDVKLMTWLPYWNENE